MSIICSCLVQHELRACDFFSDFTLQAALLEQALLLLLYPWKIATLNAFSSYARLLVLHATFQIFFSCVLCVLSNFRAALEVLQGEWALLSQQTSL